MSEHGPFCVLCGACKQHDELDGYCQDADDHRHLWNAPEPDLFAVRRWWPETVDVKGGLL